MKNQSPQRKMNLAVLLALVILLLFSGIIMVSAGTVGATRELTGTIYLAAPVPITETAGYDINVAAYDYKLPNNGMDDIWRGATVHIAPDSDHGTFSITVPDGPTASYTLEYNVDSTKGLVMRGYYQSSSKTVYKQSQATLITNQISVTTGLDFHIKKGNTITGTLSLPPGKTGPAMDGVKPYSVHVYAFLDDAKSMQEYMGGVGLDLTGVKDKPYTLCLPDAADVDASANGFVICYDLTSEYNDAALTGQNPNNYLIEGAYSRDGTTVKTVARHRQSYVQSVLNGPQSGIDMTVPVGTPVSGTIILDNSAKKTYQQMINVQLSSSNGNYDNQDDYNYYVNYPIMAGSTQAFFKLVVLPQELRSDYQLIYHFETNNPRILRDGGYSQVGTQIANMNYDLLNLNAGGISGLQFPVISTAIVSGVIQVPGTVTISPSVVVWAHLTQNGKYQYGSRLERVGNGFPFSLNVSAGDGYGIFYNVENPTPIKGNNFYDQGWFTNTGTSLEESKASTFSVATSTDTITGKNMQILGGNSLYGRIDIAEGKMTDHEVYVQVWLNNPINQERYVMTEVRIPKGSTGKNFNLVYPPEMEGQKYAITFWLNDEDYAAIGSYKETSSTGTTMSFDESTRFTLTNGMELVKNIKLVKGVRISGTISLPAPAPCNTTMAVYASPENASYSFNTGIEFIAGESGPKSFSFVVPKGTSINPIKYRLGYDTWTFKSFGYWVNTGFVVPKNGIGGIDDGMAFFEDAGQLFNVTDQPIGPINITAAVGTVYTGNLIVPGIHPAMNVDFAIENTSLDGKWANRGIGSLQTPASVDSTGAITPYRFMIPNLPGDTVMAYVINQPSEYISIGYWAESGMKWNSADATTLARDGMEHKNINISVIPGKKVTGTVKLPANMPTPTSDAIFDVAAWNDGNYFTHTYVTMKEGHSSIDYSLIVPIEGNYRFGCFLDLNASGGLVVSPTTFFNAEGKQVWTWPENNNLIPISSVTSAVDFMLMPGKYLEGTISRPLGASILNDLSFQLKIWNSGAAEDGSEYFIASPDFTIPANSDYIPYRMLVPITGNDDWSLDYQMTPQDGYTSHGYYTTNGTSYDSKDQDLIHLNDVSGRSGLYMEILPGKLMSGTVTLEKALGFDLNGYVRVVDGTQNPFSIPISITAGKTSTDWSMSIPDKSGYKIGVDWYGNNISNGWPGLIWSYYKMDEDSNSVAVLTAGEATSLNAAGTSWRDIQIMSAGFREISGTISKTSANPIVAQNIGFMVGPPTLNWLDDPVYPYRATWINIPISIPAGSTSTPFSFWVPADDIRTNYCLSYYSSDSIFFKTAGGFWNPNGTTAIVATAEKFSLKDNGITGISISMLSGVSVNGKFAFPETNGEWWGADILLIDSNGNIGAKFWREGIEPTSESGDNFEVIALPGDWRVSLTIWKKTSDTLFLPEDLVITSGSWYTASGNSFSMADATTIHVGPTGYSGLLLNVPLTITNVDGVPTITANFLGTTDAVGRTAATVREEMVDAILNMVPDSDPVSGENAAVVSLQVETSTATKSADIVLPGDLFTGINDKEAGIELDTGIGTITLNAAAVGNIVIANGDVPMPEVKIGISKVVLTTNEFAHLASTVQAEVTGRPIYDFSVSVGGEQVSIFGDNGKATVRIPYELKPGESTSGIVVYYVDDDTGELIKVLDTVYDAQSGCIEFETGHFSRYLMAYSAPVLTLPGQITVDATSSQGAYVKFDVSANDAVEGVITSITCGRISGSLFGIGDTIVTCTAIDLAGNFTILSFTVSVKYKFTGFLQPIDNPGTDAANPVRNTVKAGSAVPIKFTLQGNMGLDIIEKDFPFVKASNFANGTPDQIEEVVTAGNSGLSYSAGNNQYTYIWKTDKLWKGKKTLVVQLKDGTRRTAEFYFN